MRALHLRFIFSSDAKQADGIFIRFALDLVAGQYSMAE